MSEVVDFGTRTGIKPTEDPKIEALKTFDEIREKIVAGEIEKFLLLGYDSGETFLTYTSANITASTQLWAIERYRHLMMSGEL